MLYFCLFFIAFYTSHLSAYTLTEILSLSRKHAKEAQLFYQEKQQIEELSRSLQSAYDSQLRFDFTETKDDGLLNQLTQGERRYGINRKLGISRYFPTGTTLSLNNEWNQQKAYLNFPTNQANSLNLPRFNPIHEFKYTLTIHQQIWKNLGAKLLTLQEQVKQLASITPEYEAEIKSQAIQFEAATLYFRLISLNHTLTLVRDLIKESHNFLSLIKQRRTLGRSDDVDVASAETELIKREGLELDTLIQRDLIKTRLAHLTLKGSKTFTKPFPLTFPRHYPKYNTEKLVEQAKTSRLDIQLVDRLLASIPIEESLVSEQEKPEVNLYASFGKRGLGKNLQDANRDLDNGTLELYGLEFVWNWENQGTESQRAALMTKKNSLDLQKQIALDQTARDLELAVQKFKGSRNQEAKFFQQIRSLSKKMQAEQTKYRQVRSDQAALSRYRIEIIIAKLEEWEAITASRLHANEIRWLTHGYPRQFVR